MIDITEHNNYILITLKEEINAYNIARFKKSFFDVLERGGHNVFLDFKNMDYLDSTCISALLLCHKRMNEQKRKVIFVNVSENISQIFALAGLNDIFTLYANIPEDLLNES